MTAKRKKAKVVRLYTDDQCREWIWAFWTDAKRSVDLPVSLARPFVKRAKRGIPWNCLLAEAIMEQARVHPHHFPHKVILAYVIGSTVYIMTKVPRRSPNAKYHAVRYTHNFTPTLRKFDTFSEERFEAEFGEANRIVHLGKASKHGAPGYRGAGGGTRDGKVRIVRGAKRRAHDAHIIPPSQPSVAA